MSITCNLSDLNPRWLAAGGVGVYRRNDKGELEPVGRRHGVGMRFECPCGCGELLLVSFSNPLDGGPSHHPDSHPCWERTGDSFGALTLHPSVRRVGGCGWHGWIRDGKAVTI